MSEYLKCQPPNTLKHRERVLQAFSDGQWHDKYSLEQELGIEHGTIMSRKRDLEMQKYGGHIFQRRKSKNNNIYFYKMEGLKPKQEELF